ncbi:hypothetical protein F5B22DRAFT_649270 [Xylaria bambusicola]|uniref:uncharacterized protein n=1 Tax=Xylaria bambusicola TaxID=326684 RepID=UPI0020073E5B|nr:uncharacterized protein F5B22DRAFT_649270 [Xylaria bambusicola]KAI0509222.1 hypothetical protein F5B22DRAFT_649270 [Xylaria bambusicola]
MASQLPSFPRTIFTIVEPISLVAGFLGPLVDVDWFIASQIDDGAAAASPSVSSDNARLVALQLGNAYGLLFMVGVAVLYTTNELRVVRNYLVALLIADITHVGLTCWGLGYERAIDVAGWNAVTWGNVGFTALLGLTRTAYLLGLFGPDKPVSAAKKEL